MKASRHGQALPVQVSSQTRERYLKLAVCLVLFFTFMQCVRVTAQTITGTIPPPPSMPGLSPVQLPETREMEPEVREHLTLAQNSLAATLKDARLSAEKLGEAYGLMGQLYQAYSLSQPAKECYLNASRLAATDFRWVYLLGKLYEREGEPLQAVNYYKTARGLRSHYLPVFVSLGNLYLQLNNLEEAEANFRRALEITEASAAAQYGLGQAALSRRNYAEAAAFLERALQLAPEANRLHYALAMAYRGLGQTERAQSHLSQSGSVGVRASDPVLDELQDLIKGARLHLIRGKAALEARRFAEAATEFRKALKEQPASITAHFNLGAALTRLGDLAGALEEFKETLRLDAGHADAHYNLGLLLSQMNQHEQAITHLRLALDAEPDDNNARFFLAQELVKVRRLDDAEAELARVSQADPDNEDALLGRVKILLAKRDYGRALEALEKGHAQFPRKGLTTVTLAYLLAASPQVEQRDGARALALAQSIYEATALVNHGALVAMALAELGRCDEAASWAKRMITRAEGEGKPDLVEKLKAELNRYERVRPCRPLSGTTPSEEAPLN